MKTNPKHNCQECYLALLKHEDLMNTETVKRVAFHGFAFIHIVQLFKHVRLICDSFMYCDACSANVDTQMHADSDYVYGS